MAETMVLRNTKFVDPAQPHTLKPETETDDRIQAPMNTTLLRAFRLLCWHWRWSRSDNSQGKLKGKREEFVRY